MKKTPYLEVFIKNQIATIEFGYEKVNAMPLSLLLLLEQALVETSNNSQINLVILQSKGDNVFCAGADLKELLQIKNKKQATDFFSGFARVINAMRLHKNLIIGKVQGSAVGGGVGILSACDLVFATENMRVKLSELSIGIGPFVIAPVIERRIGITAMSQLILNPKEWKNALWAKEKGLISYLCKNKQELDNMVTQHTNELLSYSNLALLEIKKILWKNTQNWNDLLSNNASISGQLLLSEHCQHLLKSISQ